MKNEYSVYLKRCETASVVVEAKNKAEAKAKALDKVGFLDWEGDWETEVVGVEKN